MSSDNRNRTLLGCLSVVVVFSIAIAANYESISKGWQKLYGLDEVRELTYDVVAATAPLEIGPTQELESTWARTRPVLDGVLTHGEWNSVSSVEFDGTDKIRPGIAIGVRDSAEDRETSGTNSYSSSHAALYVMNDENHIYVAMDVHDDRLDFADGDVAKRDSVELFVRERLSQEQGNGGGVEHFLLILGDGKRAVGGLPGGAFATSPRPDGTGYAVEIRWTRTDSDTKIGFDVGINDSDDPAGGERRNQYYWNGTRDGLLGDEREWGLVRLADAP